MSSNTYSLLLFVALISVCSACHAGNLKKLVAGEDAYVCLHLGNTTKAFAYKVKVDKMARLTIRNDTEVTKGNPIYFRVTCDTSGMRNDSKPIFKAFRADGFFYPVHTAVVHLKDGVLTGITYDDTSASYCNSICEGSCNDITYKIEDDEMTLVEDGYYRGYGCPIDSYSKLQVYIVWTGTDKDGVQLTSAGSRFSRFSQYGGKKMYEKIIEAGGN